MLATVKSRGQLVRGEPGPRLHGRLFGGRCLVLAAGFDDHLTVRVLGHRGQPGRAHPGQHLVGLERAGRHGRGSGVLGWADHCVLHRVGSDQQVLAEFGQPVGGHHAEQLGLADRGGPP
jgi:hypothetical protein